MRALKIYEIQNFEQDVNPYKNLKIGKYQELNVGDEFILLFNIKRLNGYTCEWGKSSYKDADITKGAKATYKGFNGGRDIRNSVPFFITQLSFIGNSQHLNPIFIQKDSIINLFKKTGYKDP